MWTPSRILPKVEPITSKPKTRSSVFMLGFIQASKRSTENYASKDPNRIRDKPKINKYAKMFLSTCVVVIND